jgi:3-phenylpropionate/trans-cinnamate dioxygenase ferredoxin subunit
MAAERHVVCSVSKLPPGQQTYVSVRGKEVGVFNVDGRLFGVLNVCPHHFAPICAGEVTGTMLPGAVGEYRYGREGTILRCPWHGYEFDLEDGECTAQPTRYRLRVYKVVVEANDVVLYA